LRATIGPAEPRKRTPETRPLSDQLRLFEDKHLGAFGRRDRSRRHATRAGANGNHIIDLLPRRRGHLHSRQP
jgi:hypothetical protein